MCCTAYSTRLPIPHHLESRGSQGRSHMQQLFRKKGGACEESDPTHLATHEFLIDRIKKLRSSGAQEHTSALRDANARRTMHFCIVVNTRYG
eukprot:m.1083532 g.1083532  ORF g.1083532 m.1083532 type:complete len:92 (-) comp24269_c1_seq21:449-724(-)